MATGVYLSKGVADIFDKMKKLDIKKVNKIISDLETMMSNGSSGFTSMINMGKEKVTKDILKDVFKSKYTDKDIEDFVKVFSNFENKGSTMGANKKQGEKEQTIIKFTDDFWMMLDKIDNEVAWSLISIDSNPDIKNTLGAAKLDVSDKDYYFDIYFENGKKRPVKIIEFLRTYFGQKFTRGQIYDFTKAYNEIKKEADAGKSENAIEIPEFNFNPKDVRATFLSLVTETYPHGSEEEVVKYLPELNTDKYGNYYKIIGNSDTMFTSHLDTASRDKEKITIESKSKNNQELLMSDGSTILGADDKAGVTIMLYMMAHEVPGVYYFFLGEERGGIGSGKVADNFHEFSFLKGLKKVVSFDRRSYYSVITEQAGSECCSDEFGDSLCKELNKSGLKMGLDPTGVFTDSANFIDVIPECTNISVGYFNEHTHDEVQNITYLEKLAKACVAVDWDKLTIARKIGFDSEVLKKWNTLLKEIKETPYYNELTIKGVYGKIVVSLEFDDTSLNAAYEDMSAIETLLLLHKCNPDIRFDGNILKIEID